MKMAKAVFLNSLVLIIAISAGCTQVIGNTETPLRQTPTSSASSATPFRVPTPTPTASPMPTTTLIAIPILPVEEARTKLLVLLANNGNCRLPCIWGITPGKSSFLEARTILMPLSGISSQTYLTTPRSGGVSPFFDEGDLSIYTSLFFHTSTDDVIRGISFQVEAHKKIPDGGYENVFDPPFFGERVRFYELLSILSEHSIPDTVLIGTHGGPLTRGGTGGFYILLLYPDQGLLVNYTAQMQLVGTKVRGCPSYAHIELELYPSGIGDSFFELLEQTDWAAKMDYYKPIEEVTSMSLVDFYQTFRQPTDKCIETPANLWPVPEP